MATATAKSREHRIAVDDPEENDVRKVKLRGGYTFRSGDRVFTGPCAIHLDRETARLHKHKFEAPDGVDKDDFYLNWLTVKRHVPPQEALVADETTALKVADRRLAGAMPMLGQEQFRELVQSVVSEAVKAVVPEVVKALGHSKGGR